jgi:hypothetical protein
MKEGIYKTTSLIVLITAIAQLAMSQVHINIITKVFVSYVGFYLFLFVIAGLVTAFNTTSSLEGGKLWLFIGGVVAACITGSLYLKILLLDIGSGKYLSFEEAKFSIILIVITLAVYLIGGITMVATRPSSSAIKE